MIIYIIQYSYCKAVASITLTCRIVSEMSWKVLLLRPARFLPNIQISNRQFFTSPVLAGRGKTNWKYLSKECEERTSIILTDRVKLESLYTVPEFHQNIRDLFQFFPLSPDKVEGILLDHPDILHESNPCIEL